MKTMTKAKAQELFNSVALNVTYTDQYKINCLQYILKQLRASDVDNSHMIKLVQESKYVDAYNWYQLQLAAQNFQSVLAKKKSEGKAAKAFMNVLNK